METIGTTEMLSFRDDSNEVQTVTNDMVRRSFGHRVLGFLELAKKVAELQFTNRDHVLLFRGQSQDHRDEDAASNLKPTLFRPALIGGAPPNANELTRRFNRLKRAGDELAARYVNGSPLERERLERYRILRWSILQHYGVCDTPLLDVTQSVRIAASFASLRALNDAFVFVLGVPNVGGAVTASAEAGVQIVRLSSACPPTALRPHIQEGYLLGEYPEMAEYEQKGLYQHYEIDFGRRLIAKFRFDPQSFWKPDHFPKVEQSDLYPNAEDPLFDLTNRVREDLERGDQFI